MLVSMRLRVPSTSLLAAVTATVAAAAVAACGSPATKTSQNTTTPISSSTAVASPTSASPTTITGLFTEPRTTTPDETRHLGPAPRSFPDWDGTSTMLYDTQTGTATDLGPGSLGHFSPDSTRMVWIASPQPPFGDGEVWMVDVHTLQKRDLGPGRLAIFVDDDHVSVARNESNDSELLDVNTGARTRVTGLPAFQPALQTRTPEGYVLAPRYSTSGTGTTFTLSDPSTGAQLLEFSGDIAVPAGPRTIAIMTVPNPIGPANSQGYVPATTNIFLVDIDNPSAPMFIATSPSTWSVWRLTADADYVVWTDNVCDSTGGTRIYDRRTRRITEIDAPLWPEIVPGGLILDGPFGGRALIDPQTLEYRAAIPAGVGDSAWSPDYRYASLGQFGGHGGVCP